MVRERGLLNEQKSRLEKEMRKQEQAAQELILNKSKSSRPRLSFGVKAKSGF